MNIFAPNIPIKKSQKDIAFYLKRGPVFGEILFELYTKIKENKLRNADEVNREYIKLITKRFYQDRLLPVYHEVFPFITQKNLYGDLFPKEICVSINDCVAHGFNEEPFKEGDVISVDCGFRDTTYTSGKKQANLHYDAAFTIKIGETQDWVTTPLKALQEIIIKNPRNTLELGAVIEEIAEKNGVSTVVSLSGHGIGYSLHEAPIIYNAQGKFVNEELFDGLCFCAEPIFSLSKKSCITKTYLDSDGWAIYTRDKLPTSHFETMFCVVNGQIIDLTGMTSWSL